MDSSLPLTDGDDMQQFSKEQMQRARKADLYEYLMRYHAGQFKREGQSIHPIGNDSLSIKRGYSGYMDFATEDKGNSVDYLVKYMGYALDQAVFALCGDMGGLSDKKDIAVSDNNRDGFKEKLPPAFPEPAEGRFRQLFAFLAGRGIPAKTVQALVDQRLLYQSRERNNAVFINRERDWAEIRGTYTLGAKKFKGVAANCRADGFWWFRTGRGASVVYICEGAIDAVSLYILHMRHGKSDPAIYVSIGGVSKQPAIDRIKRQMAAVLAVDNDDAGQQCREKNPELPYILPVMKDWNEDLQAGKYYGGDLHRKEDC